MCVCVCSKRKYSRSSDGDVVLFKKVLRKTPVNVDLFGRVTKKPFSIVFDVYAVDTIESVGGNKRVKVYIVFLRISIRYASQLYRLCHV